ncbi:peptide transporter MTD1 [Mycena rebaudengoi]|nr:peptide transporter MTD1 [Mycena rebaudengoi]
MDPLHTPLEYFRDEKDDEKGEKSSIQVAEPITAEVYDDLREIDLDDNGRERPIVTDMDVATRLISLKDDPSLPAFTFRMWFLGLGLSCFGAYFRPQTISVSQLFLQILAYILGVAMQEVIPGPGNTRYSFKTPDNAFWRFMNPGPFNIKEHVAITIFASTAAHSALAISIFAADNLYYGIQPNVTIGIFTLIGSQLMGYGLGVQLFDALHRGKKIFLQKKRVKFFWLCFIAIFVWEWIPEFIAPTLTGIGIFCLAKRNSPWVTRIFGGAAGNEGLGMFALCFDWHYGSRIRASFNNTPADLTSYLVGNGGAFDSLCSSTFLMHGPGGSLGALFTPLSTQLSLYFGTMIWCNGTVYDQLSILHENFRLDEAKLAVQGLPWFASSQVLTKIGTNLSIGATITHVLVWHGKDIVRVIKQFRAGENYDPHLAKMRMYKEVPMWYITIFFASFGMAMAIIYTGGSRMPGWGLVVGILISAIFLPFVVTGFITSMQNLVQSIGASLMPGSPQTNMYFTLYGYNTLEQALGLIRELKMVSPPRVTFTGGLLNYHHREILLDVQGSNISFNADAVSWGTLGSTLYSPSGRYAIVPFSILIGLIVPVPFWLVHLKFPKLGANHVVTPILCWTLGYLSVGINTSVFSTFLLAVFSQYYLRRYRPRWFRKYNFLLSAALDGGTQVMVFVFTFAVGGGSGKVVDMPHWALVRNPICSACQGLNYVPEPGRKP